MESVKEFYFNQNDHLFKKDKETWEENLNFLEKSISKKLRREMKPHFFKLKTLIQSGKLNKEEIESLEYVITAAEIGLR